MKKLGVKKTLVWAVVAALGLLSAVALILSVVQHYTVTLPPRTQYGLVFDAGSTHTSLYLYKWPGTRENDTGLVSQKLVCDVEGAGISSYALDPPGAGRSLKKCLDVAVKMVPASQQRDIPVYLGATAGMRLLQWQNESQSKQILNEVTRAIQRYPFNFRGARILSGMEEGAFGWITTNYLLEELIKFSFNGEWVHPTRGRIWGALDMGGASTQISFTPREPVREPSSAVNLKLYGRRFQVYTHSYLCYGKEQALRQVQARLLKDSLPTLSVNHPCYHQGYSLTLTLGDLYNSPCVTPPATYDPTTRAIFSGTGDQAQCLSLMKKIFDFKNCSLFPDCGFNEVYQPPVSGNFFAFSAYFYTFDFLGLAPQAPLAKVISTIDAFCIKSWTLLVQEHPAVKEKYLRDYCVTANYIRTILLDGYKFYQSWEKIYFQRQASDTDIGWTLGYMLNLTNTIPSERPLVVNGVQRAQWAAEVFFIALVLLLSLLILVGLFLCKPDSS